MVAIAFQQVASAKPIPAEKGIAGQVPLELPDVGIVGPLVQGGFRPITVGQSHPGRCDGGRALLNGSRQGIQDPRVGVKRFAQDPRCFEAGGVVRVGAGGERWGGGSFER